MEKILKLWQERDLNSTIGNQLSSYWRNHSALIVRSPVHHKAIGSFEQANDIAFPQDFFEYLSIANGFDQTAGYQDDNGFNFWPLEKMQRLSEIDSGAFVRGESEDFFVFADYLDFCWGYAIRLRRTTGGNEIAIVGTVDGRPQVIANNFTEFARLYIEGSSRLNPIRKD